MMYFTLEEFSEDSSPEVGSQNRNFTELFESRKADACVASTTVVACSIVCTEFDDSDNLSETLDVVFKEALTTDCENKVLLTLKQTKFKNNTLTKGWISNISFQLKELTISGSSLTSISPGVFDEAAFRKLIKLELSGITLTLLQSGTFTGLSQIVFLTIRNSHIDEIDQDVFQPLSLKIRNLEIENSYVILPQFTGNSDLKNVELAQLLQVYPMDVVTPEFFSGLELVVSLYIFNNQIKEIQKSAFVRQSRMKLLHLNSNSISTLSRNVFSSSAELPKMFVADNPWNCTCELKWLQDAIREKQNETNETSKCRSPEKYDLKDIVDVDLCLNTEITTPSDPETTVSIATDITSEPETSVSITPVPTDSTEFSDPTESTKPTDSTEFSDPTYSTDPTDSTNPTESNKPTDSTESSDPTYSTDPTDSTDPTESTNSTDSSHPTVSTDVQINCTKQEDRSLLFSRQHRRRLLWSRSNANDLELSQQSLKFSIEDNESGMVTVTINSSVTQSDILIWFIGSLDYTGVQKTSSNSIGCFKSLGRETSVTDLTTGEAYVFCLLNDGERRVSPLDCRAHIVSVPWHQRAWLSNENRDIFIGCTSLALGLCLVSGAFLVYCLIRKNPSLLRGSKRVVMVKHRAADAIVMPPNFKEVCEKRKDVKRPPKSSSLANKRSTFRRSISETSIISARSAAASYVSAVEPTPVQLLHWRLERLRSSPPGGEQRSPVAYLMPPAPHSTSSPPVPPMRPPITDFILETDSLSGISEIDT